jgi:hypothetical protein
MTRKEVEEYNALVTEYNNIYKENKELHNKIDKAIEYIEKFSDPSIGAIKKILKDSDVDV